MKIRTYSELIRINSFEERYDYLRLSGVIGINTFGYDRYLNQILYTSKRWLRTRDGIIIRDNGCDLAMSDYEIRGRIVIHHMNPITIEDVEQERESLYDPNFLICTSYDTHMAIHYSNEGLLPKLPIERKRNDTCPWR